jgi:hypothetical protein
VLSVLILAGTLLISHQEPGGAGAVHLIIVDDTDTPLSGAQVFLDGEAKLHRRVLSGDDGSARFDALPPGRFLVHAQKSGYLSRMFGSAQAPVVRIAVSAGETFTATLTLPRAGAVSGSVLGVDGRPARAVVRAWRIGEPVRSVRTTRSMSDGIYRVDDLEPGDYVVSALGPNLPVDGRVKARLVYVPVFFHGTFSATAAMPVPVRSGTATTGIDLTLQLSAMAELEGLVLDAQGQRAANAAVQLENTNDDGMGPLTVRTSPAGTFSLALLPGTYTLTARNRTAQEVTVPPGVTTRITVPLERPSRITGRLRVSGSATRALATGATVISLMPRTPFPGAGGAVPVQLGDPAAMTFAVEDVAAGDYRIQIPSALDGWMVDSVVVDGRELVDGMLSVAPGADLTDVVVSLSPTTTEIAGSIVDSSGAPVYQQRVVIMAVDPASWVPGSRRVAWAQPDTKGQFVVRGLPAGEYFLAAVAGTTSIEIERVLLEAAAAQALRITLPPGGRVEQRVMIAR